MDDGNTCYIVVWLDDTVIVKKPMAEKAYYFVADSRTGEPVAQADVELFGWRMFNVDGKNEYRVETKTLKAKTDNDGQVIIPLKELTDPRGYYQWLVTARTAEGRFAHLGFSNVWLGRLVDPAYDQVKAYAITDRPVYRPGGPVRFKFWVGRARYDQPGASEFAGKSFTGRDPESQREKIFTKRFVADEFGGFDGSFELPSEAALGVYHGLHSQRWEQARSGSRSTRSPSSR